MAPAWRCPVCGGALADVPGGLVCGKGHRFDRARNGYVNLLLQGGSGKRHGDDTAMVQSRRAFLERGYYAPVRDAVLRSLALQLPQGGVILDAGCGEGYYTAAVASMPGTEVLGTDISRPAVKACAGRGIRCAVASSARLPLEDGCCDGVLSLFAPVEAGEFRRVLRPGGVLVTAVPLSRHLWSLKAAVYDRPYENDPPAETIPGFLPAGHTDVEEEIFLPAGEDVTALFRMTPYWYRTSRTDQEKLGSLDRLETELSVRVAAWRRD